MARAVGRLDSVKPSSFGEEQFTRVAKHSLIVARSERGDDSAQALALHYQSLPVEFWRIQ
jgi:hypothetical protein